MGLPNLAKNKKSWKKKKNTGDIMSNREKTGRDPGEEERSQKASTVNFGSAGMRNGKRPLRLCATYKKCGKGEGEKWG